jgi:hypothetical protein
MANQVCNIAKGRFAYYCTLPNASDALIVVPIETTGLEADDTLNNYDDLAALLAASNNEQATIGRKTVSSGVTVTVDDTNNLVDVDMPDQTWTGTSGNAISKLLICYDGDTGAGTDSNIIPLTHHDFVVSMGGDITAQIATAGFARAS